MAPENGQQTKIFSIWKTTMVTRQDCIKLDEQDVLAACRDKFTLPEGEIYLDGNSLGAMPSHVPARMQEVIAKEWAQGLIRSWNDANWIDLPQRVAAKVARLVGAGKHEVMVADSTSVNLYKALVAAVRMNPGRKVILTERGNFPTDLYIAQGVAEIFGLEIRYVESTAEAVLAGLTTALACDADACQLSQRPDLSDGGNHGQGPRRGRTGIVGPGAQRRCR